MPRYAVRLAAAVFLAAAGLGVPAAAHAATCSTSHGVTVVVDFHQLGGGVQTACDIGGGGRSGDKQMSDVGHRLTYVTGEPFVCRVDGAPASDPCQRTPPSDAYWSLWWSDGKSGTWSYSAQGIASVSVPDGGYLALSWQGGDSSAPPRVSPKAQQAPSPSPTHEPSSRPTKKPTTAPASTGATATPPDAPTGAASSPSTGGRTATPLHPRTHRPSSAAATPSPSGVASDATQASAAPERAVSDTSGSSGLPGWVAPLAVALLLGAAATVAVVRRKRSGGA